MSKIRIHELAKEIKMASKDLLEVVRKMGVKASNHMVGLDSSVVDKIRHNYSAASKAKSEAGVQEKRPKKQQSNSLESSHKRKKTSDTQVKEQRLKKPHPSSQEEQKKKRPQSEHGEVKKTRLQTVDENNHSKSLKKRPHAATSSKKTSDKARGNDKSISQKKPLNNKRSNERVQSTSDSNNNKSSSQFKTSQKKTVRPEHKHSKKDVEHSHSTKHNMQKSKVERDKKQKDTKKNEHVRKNNKQYANNQTNARPALSMQKKTRKKKSKKKREQVEEPMINETVETITIVALPQRTTVGDFAGLIDKSANEVILKLMNLGTMAAINQYVEYDIMAIIAEEFGIQVEPLPEVIDEDILDYDFEDSDDDLVSRAPVVTVMGHVDHGKTSLLDAIRSTSVTTAEAGGITQHIGASEIMINDQKIVFLDTPGHEAFTSLRARGAKVTDIAILVVAADDGVMPQTIEAIDHARAADVPIIVAVNKIDKAGANPDRVKQELSEQGVLVEDWGGDVVCVHVSALKGENIDQLLEMVLLVAEMKELKANPKRNAVGTVIEANLDKGRGAVATVLIQNGHLKVGDPFVCGTTYGRVRAMQNSKGKRIKNTGPSSAVEIIGMNEVAMAGDKFFAIDSDKEAKQIAEKRGLQIKSEALKRASGHVTLEDIFNQIQAGKMKELNLIIKADAHGSLEALRGSLMKLNNEHDEVNINIQHANIGAITESDIMLATASNTIVLGFNVRPSSTVIAMAKKENVEIKTYRIIYELLNDIESAMKGMLDPEFKEEQLGEVEVRATFKVPNIGTIAGGYVLSGKVLRNSKVRLLREGIIVHEGDLSSLKRFKDDVKEVASGYECGLGLANFNDLKEGDIIEAYHIVEIPRK